MMAGTYSKKLVKYTLIHKYYKHSAPEGWFGSAHPTVQKKKHIRKLIDIHTVRGALTTKWAPVNNCSKLSIPMFTAMDSPIADHRE